MIFASGNEKHVSRTEVLGTSLVFKMAPPADDHIEFVSKVWLLRDFGPNGSSKSVRN
jgi:hypothetical protein